MQWQPEQTIATLTAFNMTPEQRAAGVRPHKTANTVCFNESYSMKNHLLILHEKKDHDGKTQVKVKVIL